MQKCAQHMKCTAQTHIPLLFCPTENTRSHPPGDGAGATEDAAGAEQGWGARGTAAGQRTSR